MDLYEVIISPKALSLLDGYIDYIQYKLKNEQAAEAVWQDAVETEAELEKAAGSLNYCTKPILRELGYRSILFRRHRYVMLYRIEGRKAYVDGVYHLLQDYEKLFIQDLISG